MQAVFYRHPNTCLHSYRFFDLGPELVPLRWPRACGRTRTSCFPPATSCWAAAATAFASPPAPGTEATAAAGWPCTWTATWSFAAAFAATPARVPTAPLRVYH